LRRPAFDRTSSALVVIPAEAGIPTDLNRNTGACPVRRHGVRRHDGVKISLDRLRFSESRVVNLY
jgi:hypothetical protein